MLRSLFIHNIGIVKPTEGSINALGENVRDYSGAATQYTKEARVEESNTNYQHNESGQRDNKRNIIYVLSTVDVELRDLVEFPIGTDFGYVISKNPHYKATSSSTNVYELVVERK